MKNRLPVVLGMVSLVVGFSLLLPALGFICAGALLLAPVFLKRGN